MFYSYDWLLVGALLVGLCAVYAVSRWLYYEKREQAIQRELDELAATHIDFSRGYTAPDLDDQEAQFNDFVRRERAKRAALTSGPRRTR